MANLKDIEGVGVVYAERLRGVGIGTTNALLKQGATPQGRKEIADKTGLSHSLILEWVNHVDLFRVRGVQEEYADLLEEGGVDTVPELAQRNAENLYQTLVEINREKRLVRRLPARTDVASWIEQARQLPRVITY